MREILFRAKRKDNGKWVYGDLVRIKDGDNIIPYIYYHGEAIPETVGQFTGLTDKNGKKIFEGDILRGSWNTTFEVYFDDCYLQYRAKTIDGFEKDINYYGYPHQIEVIGNICDTQKLIGGKSK